MNAGKRGVGTWDAEAEAGLSALTRKKALRSASPRPFANSPWPLLVSCVSILMAACASKQVDYSSDIQNATDFAKKVVVELSGGLDKGLSSATGNKVSESDGLRTFTADFYPRHGREAVTASFDSYCKGAGGPLLVDGWCWPKDKEKPGFFLGIENLYTSVAGATHVRIKVVEPASASPLDLRRFADFHTSIQNERAAARRAAAEQQAQYRAKADRQHQLDQQESQEKRQALKGWEQRSLQLRQDLKVGDSVVLLVRTSGFDHIVEPTPGLVIEVRRPVAYVQVSSLSPTMRWVKLDELYANPAPAILRCSKGSSQLCLLR